jgi:hypothetical protein
MYVIHVSLVYTSRVLLDIRLFRVLISDVYCLMIPMFR